VIRAPRSGSAAAEQNALERAQKARALHLCAGVEIDRVGGHEAASLVLAFTAYARHLQSTVITLEQQIPGAAGRIATPGQQTLRTLTLVLGWPAALGIGMLFVAWWKAAALVAGAFLLLVPVIGSLMPRPMSAHYLDRIRADLEQRLSRGGHDAAPLRRIIERLDALSADRPQEPPRSPPARPT
jgi:hypothetical protein